MRAESVGIVDLASEARTSPTRGPRAGAHAASPPGGKPGARAGAGIRFRPRGGTTSLSVPIVRLALRGYDGVHLATALRAVGSDGALVTWDREIALAALAEGLAVIPSTRRHG